MGDYPHIEAMFQRLSGQRWGIKQEIEPAEDPTFPVLRQRLLRDLRQYRNRRFSDIVLANLDKAMDSFIASWCLRRLRG